MIKSLAGKAAVCQGASPGRRSIEEDEFDGRLMGEHGRGSTFSPIP
jgi:hypothetical protein